MATTPAETRQVQRSRSARIGCTCFLDQIASPGCYVVRETGRLLRVTAEQVRDYHRPGVPSDFRVTKISSDPGLSRIQARQVAARFDLDVTS
ncbi:MAG: hypothetical protein AAF533_09915 [Acidobacteriota bacterium]